jgi:DNA repair protein RadC
MQTKLTQIQANVKLLQIKEAKGEPFRSTEDVWKHMHLEALIDRECAWVLHLNGRNQIIEKELVSMGSADYSILQPREVFRRAIIQGSSAIIVVHNHPSGEVTPSDADIETCERLLAAAELLRIPMHDFVIIGKSYTSFLEKKIGGFK